MISPTPFVPNRSGVYAAPADLERVRSSVDAAGGSWFDIDLTRARSKEQLLDAFAVACDFPSTFGRNWDALADALQDLSWRPARGYVLHLRQAAHAARALDGQWQTLLEVLRADAMYWKQHGKPFIVFVDDAEGLQPWI